MDVGGECNVVNAVISPETKKGCEITGDTSLKKLKQTQLCFKVLDSGSAVPSVATQPSKKRRLSDVAPFTKPVKHSKKVNLDSKKKKSVGCDTNDEGDKEVSSSCEMEGIQPFADSSLNVAGRHGNATNLLQKFIYIGQPVEVSTTSSKEGDVTVELTLESENEAEVASTCENKDWVSRDVKADIEDKENVPDIVEGHQHSCGSDIKTDSECSNETSQTHTISAKDADKASSKDKNCFEGPRPGVTLLSESEPNSVVKDSSIGLESDKTIEVVKELAENIGDIVETTGNAEAHEKDFVDADECKAIESSKKVESQAVEQSAIKTNAEDHDRNFIDAEECKDSESSKEAESQSMEQSTKRGKTAPSAKKEKLEQKEKERLAKQKQKEEIEEQKKKEKEKKEREKIEAKLQKEKEKSEKEKEREEKKRQKEEERQKRLEQQEEEKRKKEEAKLEEKKRKEEEKRKKDEKLEKEKVCLKEKQLMQNFFIKTTKDTTSIAQQIENVQMGPFMPFEPKKNMRLAPISRFDCSNRTDRISFLDSVLLSQLSPCLYIEELKKNLTRPGKSGKTWPKQETSDVMIVETGSTMKAKFFKYHENYRPAYYGTWRKRSGLVSARHPFAKDIKWMDYEVDSDDEWEEEEPGESLSHSEGEEETEQDAEPEDEEGDGFFVPHGYLSEGEGCNDEEEEELSPEKLKDRQLAKARNWEAEMNVKRCEILRPICIGICWWTPDELSYADSPSSRLKEFEAVLFEPQPIILSNMSHMSMDGSRAEQKDCKKKQKGKEKGISYISVPESAIPDLMKLVHGNECSIFRLVKEFQEFWRQKSTAKSVLEDEIARDKDCGKDDELTDKDAALTLISKRKLDAKIREFSTYERRPNVSSKKFWYVNSTSLERYGLSELSVPTQWQWITKVPKQLKNVEKVESSGTSDKVVKSGGLSTETSILQFTTQVRSITENSSKKGSEVKLLGNTIPIVNSSASVDQSVKQASGQGTAASSEEVLKPKPACTKNKLTTRPNANLILKSPRVVIKKLKTGTNSKPSKLLSSEYRFVSPSQKRPSDGCEPEAKRPYLVADMEDDDCMVIGVEKISRLRETLPSVIADFGKGNEVDTEADDENMAITKDD